MWNKPLCRLFEKFGPYEQLIRQLEGLTKALAWTGRSGTGCWPQRETITSREDPRRNTSSSWGLWLRGNILLRSACWRKRLDVLQNLKEGLRPCFQT